MKTKDRILFLLAFFTFFAASFGGNLVINITALLPFGKYSWLFVSSLETIVLSSVWWWGKSFRLAHAAKVDQAPFVFQSENESPVVINMPSILPQDYSDNTTWMKKEEILVVMDYLHSLETYVHDLKLASQVPDKTPHSIDQIEIDCSMKNISLMSEGLLKYKVLALNASLESNFNTASGDPYKKLSASLFETTEKLILQLDSIKESVIKITEGHQSLQKSEESFLSKEVQITTIKNNLKQLEILACKDDQAQGVSSKTNLSRHEIILQNVTSLLGFLNQRLGKNSGEELELDSSPEKNVA